MWVVTGWGSLPAAGAVSEPALGGSRLFPLREKSVLLSGPRGPP